MYINVKSSSDASNLSNLIKSGDWMVLYYAEWCGHCKTMKPEWQKVVSNLSNPKINTNKVNVAEIESSHIGNLVNKPEIEGFPTIKMYNNGKEIANFDDARVANKIEEFANNNATKEKKASTINIPLNNKPNPVLNNAVLNNLPQLANAVNIEEEPKPNEINMNNLIMKINNKIEHNIKPREPKVNILDLPCTSIIRAKPCKSNPKCMYDGSDLKCKDRIFKQDIAINNKKENLNMNMIMNKSKTNNMVGNIILKNSSRKPMTRTPKSRSLFSRTPKSRTPKSRTPKSRTPKSRTPKSRTPKSRTPKFEYALESRKPKSRTPKSRTPKFEYALESRKPTARRTKNTNVKKTTKSVFEQLIKSFQRIGNEAEKDSKLLKKASNKL
jgi:thiol-disulfide isomerase/thioredoxin